MPVTPTYHCAETEKLLRRGIWNKVHMAGGTCGLHAEITRLEAMTLLKLMFEDGVVWIADVENQIISTHEGAFCVKFSVPVPGERFSCRVGDSTVVYFRKVLKVATV